MLRISRQRRRRGFTLIELLLVVGILVMLAAFAFPSFMGTREQANIDMTTAQLGTFENALRLYQAHANGYPTTEQGLTALLEEPEQEPVPKKWAGPYLEGEEFVDAWGSEFNYEYEPGEPKPRIWSNGPDRQEGTEDDIRNWKDDDAASSESDR